MYKNMICLKRPASLSPDQFSLRLQEYLQGFCNRFAQLSLAVVDAGVAAATPSAMVRSSHPNDAVVSIWCEHILGQEDFVSGLDAVAAARQSYAVVEMIPKGIVRQPGRVAGMCQIAFLQMPPRLAREEWLKIWLQSHTQVAIETQSTFSYRQNIVAIPESGGEWPQYDAIVEENFPAAALTDRLAFFAASGDKEKFRKNQDRMVESCLRFIDFDRFECVPMSEYILK